ncbi:MAG: DUF1552 domain-containing protein [Phycisphaerales bacterium]|nr:DUF1552 domain-containing protein [Phycisphaerales bacterium]
MSTFKPIDRRMVLRGLGTAVALPWLEAMTPVGAMGRALAGSTPGAPPLRSAFLFIPNGVHAPDWSPTGTGADYELSPLLKPLARHRSDLSVLSGLGHHNAKALGDGPGDHARSSACFLTGAHPVKTDGADIRAGISIDQVMAQQYDGVTRFASLELGCEPGLQSGSCDSGYSCAYSANISWRTPGSPMAKEINPRLLFERLFQVGPAGESAVQRAERLARRRSILDYVSGDARRLHRQLGLRDREKMDEYLEGVRSIERRLEQVERVDRDPAAIAGVDPPAGIPGDYREHLRLMHELMVLSFRLDLTRVCTMMWANEGTNRSFPFLEIPEGHHHLSHHKGDVAMIEKIRRINQFQSEMLAELLDLMAETPEGEGRLLDNVMLVYGGAISDGNRHDHDDLPIVLAGGGGGTIHTGHHKRYSQGTPLCNLYLSMLERMGVDAERFGDSTGVLSNLA